MKKTIICAIAITGFIMFSKASYAQAHEGNQESHEQAIDRCTRETMNNRNAADKFMGRISEQWHANSQGAAQKNSERAEAERALVNNRQSQLAPPGPTNQEARVHGRNG